MFQRAQPQPAAPLPEPATSPTFLPNALYQQLVRLYSSTQTAPEVLDLLMEYAASNGVSDILLEPTENKGVVRMRVDGVLRVATEIPTEMYPAVVARVKVLANLDSGNLRTVTQEGKFVFKSEDSQSVTVRVAMAIVANGEFVALRLHDTTSMSKTLADHGMSDTLRQPFEKLLKAKSGLIVVCGPTGGGKTATLYSSLQMLNTGTTNIISIEDPVEYVLPGINQMEVDHEHGLSFAQGLRVTLRLNPDVIFVGEVRDKETAQIAIESALTGHLVLSTLHANSAVSAVSRLLDLEIEKFFISAALKAVLCQRLVRRTCPTCGAWQAPSTEEAAAYQKLTGTTLAQQFVGAGCEACGNTGFKGRIALFELIVVDDAVRTVIAQDLSEQDMLATLRQNGFHILLEDGLAKVQAGLTTVMEVVTQVYAGS